MLVADKTRGRWLGGQKQSANFPVSGVTMIKVMASHRTSKKPKILTKVR
jgi:hypothetical protein